MNLVEKAISHGGELTPLIIPSEITGGTGLMNPSIFIDDDGDLICVLRHINYSLYHSENNQRFPSIWGPLSYLHPEQDQHLRTTNYLCRLNPDFTVKDYCLIEMMNLHEPIWEFVGLEDARLTKWEGRYYISGVRRDTTVNGQGRMEVCEIAVDKENWTCKEIFRQRIEVANAASYCEKNYAPILDRPFEFVKWHSPVEIIKAENNFANVVAIKEGLPFEQRGGSQVIPYKNGYVEITHEVVLTKNYLGQKDGIYRHRLISWDKDLNILGATEIFSFLDAKIEFVCGIANLNNDLLIGFGFQDNAAFILRVPETLVDEMVASCVLKL